MMANSMTVPFSIPHCVDIRHFSNLTSKQGKLPTISMEILVKVKLISFLSTLHANIAISHQSKAKSSIQFGKSRKHEKS